MLISLYLNNVMMLLYYALGEKVLEIFWEDLEDGGWEPGKDFLLRLWIGS